MAVGAKASDAKGKGGCKRVVQAERRKLVTVVPRTVI